VTGWPLRWRAAAMARWRTASGLRGGHAQAVAGEGLAQRRPGGAQFLSGSVDAAQLLGQRVGALGFGPVGEEAAGLPAHPPLQRRQAPLGEGGLDRAIEADHLVPPC
jgi:hypothetical protein